MWREEQPEAEGAAMTAIAEIVARLIAAGTPAELAAMAVAEAFAAGVSLRNSAEIPRNKMDETAERRRAKDRDRKRLSAETPRNSAEFCGNSETVLTLTSSPSTKEFKKEVKKVSVRKSQLSAEWQPSESHYKAAERLKIPRPAVLEKAEDMRLWAKSKGELKADWDATFHGFLRRDAAKLSGANNGQASTNRFRNALDKLREHVGEIDRGEERRGEVVGLLPRR